MKRVVGNKQLEMMGIVLVFAPTNHYQIKTRQCWVSLTIPPEMELPQIVELVFEAGRERGIKQGKNEKILEIRRVLNEVD